MAAVGLTLRLDVSRTQPLHELGFLGTYMSRYAVSCSCMFEYRYPYRKTWSCLQHVAENVVHRVLLNSLPVVARWSSKSDEAMSSNTPMPNARRKISYEYYILPGIERERKKSKLQAGAQRERRRVKGGTGGTALLGRLRPLLFAYCSVDQAKVI